jgi:hypothetical protein
VLQTLNWLRRRAGRPPLYVEGWLRLIPIRKV